jgi:high-affinity K+ transport system ATPase subunit B
MSGQSLADRLIELVEEAVRRREKEEKIKSAILSVLKEEMKLG